MIKFFRKIRQNLVSKNKIGKYLLYAVGEIILVIIGILIAINLNQKSEQKKTEARIDAVFEDLLIELKSDINQSTNLIRIYRTKDSLASLVLNTTLSYADYAAENSDQLWRIATSFGNFDTSNKAYDLLMTNVDAIPDKYDKVLVALDKVHNRYKPNVDLYNEKVWQLVSKNLDDFEENYEWYNASDFKKSAEAINYRLNNFQYKNKVKRYRGEAFTHKYYIGSYRFYAIKAYQEIASILNKATDSLPFNIKYNALDEYAGNYVNDAISESKITILLETDFLRLKSENQVDELLIALSANNVFFPGNPINKFYRFDKNTKTKKIVLTQLIGHESTTYTKVD
tara:strand:+ start:91787 stop:92809 length:1023 start_codon:yes stop_codon:yes gene_type:complete